MTRRFALAGALGWGAAWALCACSGGAPAAPVERPPVEPTGDVPHVPTLPLPLPVDPPPGGDDVQLRGTMPNGLTTLAFRCEPATPAMAEIALAVLVGSDHGKQGVAELAANQVLASGDATAGRPDLPVAIAQLGGNCAVEQGLLVTWFTLRVPADRWQQALQLLAGALQQPALGRTQLERRQQALLQERAAAVIRDPQQETARCFLLGDQGPDAEVAALMERDPGEAVLFRARNYRPDRAVLALMVPGSTAEIGAAVAGALGTWAPPVIAPDPLAGPHGRRMPSGIHWAPGPGDCRVAVVLSLPEPVRQQAPAMYALLSCLTMEGVGGRLERLLQEQGLGQLLFTARFVGSGEATAMVLSTITGAGDIGRLWQVLQAARQSLRELPPTASEQSLARARARLLLRRAEADVAGNLRAMATRALIRVDEAKVREWLAALDQPDALGPAAATEFLGWPVALIVIGSTPPADLPDVQQFALLPPGIRSQLPGPGGDELIAAAGLWLAKAVDAVGGAERVAQVTGYAATATIVTDGAPAIEEAVDFRIGGTLRRTRTTLGTTVETVIAGSDWSERIEAERTQLTPQQTSWRLAEAERHPLALLAAHVRGKLRFRLLTSREFEERDHMVLEAVGERFDRLRIHIDRESGLLRVVESWSTSPEGNPTYVVDAWSDHRTVAGLRVPFRRETSVDDGQSRRVATYATFRPTTD